jgi:hypothetical protein
VISDTLAQLDVWYGEPTAGPERPKLLSKLALLELCGWLEVELDRIILAVQATCLNDEAWVRRELVDRTYGFRYHQHFRPMLSGIIGEHATRAIEREMGSNHPGDIDRLVSYTSALWDTRCSFAHADVANNVVTQQRFDAPSWSTNQYRLISKILPRLEATAVNIARQL